MALLKCPICGEDIVLSVTREVNLCPCCRSKFPWSKRQSPNADSFDTATKFRIDMRFADAERILIRIIAEEPRNAEAYFSLLLCRYGVVFTNSEFGYVPKCYRKTDLPVVQDEYYKSAENLSDGDKKQLLLTLAQSIEAVRNNVCAIPTKPHVQKRETAAETAAEKKDGSSVVRTGANSLIYEDSEELCRKAVDALAKREFFRAVDYFNIVTSRDPEFSRIWFVACMAEHQCANTEEMISTEGADWLNDEKFLNAVKFADAEDRAFYDDLTEKRIASLREQVFRSLEKQNFAACLTHCRAYLAKKEEDGSVWWVKLLAENGCINSNELEAKCLAELRSFSGTEEFAKAVEYGSDEDRRVYETVADAIDTKILGKSQKVTRETTLKHMKSALERYDVLEKDMKIYRVYAEQKRMNSLDRFRKLRNNKVFYNNPVLAVGIAALFFVGAILADDLLFGAPDAGVPVYMKLKRDMIVAGIAFGFTFILKTMLCFSFKPLADNAEFDCEASCTDLQRTANGENHIKTVVGKLREICRSVEDAPDMEEDLILEKRLAFDEANQSLLKTVESNGWKVGIVEKAK